MQDHFLLFILFLAATAIVSFAYAIWRGRNDGQILRNIIQGSPIPTFVISTDHKILHWNKALEGLSGIKAKEVLGTSQQWRAFYSSPRACMADLILRHKLSNSSHLYSGEVTKSKVLKDAYEVTQFFSELGEKGKWFRITSAGIKDSRGRIFGAMETLEDITDQKLAEEELLKRSKLESLGTFADGVAKDFDSLLSAILRNVFLAKISANEEDKILENGLAIAERASLQAKELAHRLITFAQGGYPVKKMESVGELIKETVQKTLAGSNVTCQPVIPSSLWPVEIDAMQIKQVIENMVTNAKEAIPNGGIAEVIAENTTTGTNIWRMGEGNYIRITIKDHGIGIPHKNLSKIFDPYFTTKEKKERGGIGLGLAICDSIIKYHNGLITVESIVGSGTTFCIYLAATPNGIPEGQKQLDA